MQWVWTRTSYDDNHVNVHVDLNLVHLFQSGDTKRYGRLDGFGEEQAFFTTQQQDLNHIIKVPNGSSKVDEKILLKLAQNVTSLFVAIHIIFKMLCPSGNRKTNIIVEYAAGVDEQIVWFLQAQIHAIF